MFSMLIDQKNLINILSRFQDVISDITKRMGKGMGEFIEREVVSVDDWNLYCHYVAGLVGIGLSGLFANSGLEGKTLLLFLKF